MEPDSGDVIVKKHYDTGKGFGLSINEYNQYVIVGFSGNTGKILVLDGTGHVLCNWNVGPLLYEVLSNEDGNYIVVGKTKVPYNTTDGFVGEIDKNEGSLVWREMFGKHFDDRLKRCGYSG